MSLNNPDERRRGSSRSPGARAPSPPDDYSPPRSSRYAEPSSSRYYDDDDAADRSRGGAYEYEERTAPSRPPRDARDREEDPRYAPAPAPYRAASPPYSKKATFAMPGGFGEEDDAKVSKFERQADYSEERKPARRDDSPPPREPPRERPRYAADAEPEARYKRDEGPQYKPRYDDKPRYADAEPERKPKPKDYYEDESPPPPKVRYAEPEPVSRPQKSYGEEMPPRRPKYAAAPDSPPKPKFAAPEPAAKPRYATADPHDRGGNPKYYDDDDSDDSDDSDDHGDHDGPTGDRKLNIEVELNHDHTETTVRKREKHRHHESPEYHAAALVTTTESSRYAEPKRWEYAHPEEKITYSSKTESYASKPVPGQYDRPAYERPEYERPEYERPEYAPSPSGRRAETRMVAGSGGQSTQTEVVTVEPGRRNRASSRLGPGGLLGVAAGPGAGASLANAPGSPMLEAYRGTYQSIGSMPSPLTISTKPFHGNADVDVFDMEPPASPASKRRHARFHDLQNEASILKKALRETKSKAYPDPQPFIDILPALSAEQIMELRVEYKKQVKTPDMKGVNVAKHIKVRLKEDKYFLKACYATALGRWESEAYWANSYYQGSQTSRELLIESLMGRTNGEVRQIKAAFRDKKYSDSLARCMRQELKDDKFKKAVMLVLEERRMEETPGRAPDRALVDQDVRDLHRAVRSERGGESAMVGIVVLRSDSHIREILRVYEATHRANFAREMLKKSGNLVGEMLAHILNGIINRPVRDALLLRHALSLGASDSQRVDLLISRLVRCHWDRAHLEAVKREFRGRYGLELQAAVREGTKGFWGEFCEELCVRRTGDEVRHFERERVERVGGYASRGGRPDR